MTTSNVYILGGYQTDFAANYSTKGKPSADLLRCLSDSVIGALTHCDIAASSIQCAHVGNFAAELFCGQGHLGGLFSHIDSSFNGLPTSRHEAACASGSMAILAAMADIKAQHYDLIAVSGVEFMRNVNGQKAAEHLGAAAWVGEEAVDAQFPWPYLFNQIGDMYQQQYGLSPQHLAEIAKINYSNARHNPNAQTRDWQLDPLLFTDNERSNPFIEGQLRKSDCGRITDGSATIILASAEQAILYAKRRDIAFDSIPYIKGWGHHTAPLLLSDKLNQSTKQKYPFPHLRHTIVDALQRAHINNIEQIDAIETHDCFTALLRFNEVNYRKLTVFQE